MNAERPVGFRRYLKRRRQSGGKASGGGPGGRYEHRRCRRCSLAIGSAQSHPPRSKGTEGRKYMKFSRFAARASVLAFAAVTSAGGAQSVDPLAEKFGARESVRDISIAHEGSQRVLLAPGPDGAESAVVVSLADGSAVPVLGANGTTEQIVGCSYVI